MHQEQQKWCSMDVFITAKLFAMKSKLPQDINVALKPTMLTATRTSTVPPNFLIKILYWESNKTNYIIENHFLSIT